MSIEDSNPKLPRPSQKWKKEASVTSRTTMQGGHVHRNTSSFKAGYRRKKKKIIEDFALGLENGTYTRKDFPIREAQLEALKLQFNKLQIRSKYPSAKKELQSENRDRGYDDFGVKTQYQKNLESRSSDSKEYLKKRKQRRILRASDKAGNKELLELAGEGVKREFHRTIEARRKKRAEEVARKRLEKSKKERHEFVIRPESTAFAHSPSEEETLPTSRVQEVFSEKKKSSFMSDLYTNFGHLQEARTIFKKLGPLMDIAPFIHHVSKCTSFMDYTIACVGFLRTETMRGLIHTLTMEAAHEFVVQCVGKLKRFEFNSFFSSTVRPEAFSDSVEFVFARLHSLAGGEFLTSLRNIIVGAYAMKFGKKGFFKTIIAYVGSVPTMSLLDFVPYVGKVIVDCIRFVEALIAGVPVGDYLFSQDPVQSVIEDSQLLLQKEGYTYSGLPVEGLMERTEYFTHACDLYDRVVALEKISAYCSPKRRQLSEIKLKLSATKINMTSALRAEDRMVPFGWILCGPPGSGKSKIMPFVNEGIDQVVGRPYTERATYCRPRSSPFFTGYVPLAHPRIYISELCDESVEMARSNMNEQLSTMLSLLDSAPFPCDMAEVENKGKVYACPEVVFADTNNPGLHAKIQKHAPAALLRRFTFMEVSVKPEFRVLGGESLDSSKSLAAGGDILDRYHITIYQMIPLSNTESQKKIILSRGSIYDARDVMAQLFRDHLLTNSEVRRRAAEAGNRPAPVPQPPVNDETESQRAIDLLFDQIDEFVSDEEEDSSLEDPIRTESLKMPDLSMAEDYTNAQKIVMFAKSGFFTARDWGLNLLCNFLLPGIIYLLCASVRYQLSGIASCVFWYLGYLGYGTTICFIVGNLAGMSFLPVTSRLIRFMHFLESRIVQCFGYPVKLWNFDSRLYQLKEIVFFFAALHLSYKWYKYWKPVKPQSRSTFVVESDYNPKINDQEDKFGCESEIRKVVVNRENMKIWNTREVVPLDSKCFNNSSDIMNTINRNLYEVQVRWENPEYNSKGLPMWDHTHILGIYGDVALINLHVFKTGRDSFEILRPIARGASNPKMAVTKVARSQIQRIADDIGVIRMNAVIFTDIRNYFLSGPTSETILEANVAGYLTSCCFGSYPKTIQPDELNPSTHFIISDYWEYKWPDHEPGACGTPVFAKCGGGTIVVGIHSAAQDFSHLCYAPSITQLHFERIETGGLMDLFSFPKTIPESTVAPSKHSPFRFENLGGLIYFGAVPGVKVFPNQRSKVIKTPFSKLAREQYDCPLVDGQGRELFGAPPMRHFTKNGVYYNPYNIALKKLSHNKPGLDRQVLEKISDILVERFSAGLGKVSPITVECAINGIRDDCIARRMNANTSGGFGFEGKKRDWLPIVEELDDYLKREPIEELKKRLNHLLDSYMSGEIQCFIYKAHLKDEPRLEEKNREGKTRVFYITPIDALILQRMFLYPLYNRMIDNQTLFCSAVGIDMHRGAQDLVLKLNSFSKYYLEWDYSSYDQTMPFEIRLTTATIVARTLEECGYNDRAMKIVKGLLTDGLFPMVLMLGDLLMALGLQPSGKAATAEDNGISGVVNIMYYWYTHPKLKDLDFFQYVKPVVYGDDLLAAIKKEMLKFLNNILFQDFARDVLGMKVTPAQKNQEFAKSLSLKDVSFLKRKFVFSRVLERWVAPLDIQSVTRMCTYYIPSKSVSETTQFIDIVTSSLWEWFFHCKTNLDYDKVRDKWIEALCGRYAIDPDHLEVSLPTFNQLIERLSIEDHSVKPESSLSTVGTTYRDETQYATLLLAEYYQQLEDLLKSPVEPDVFGDTPIRILRKQLAYLSYPHLRPKYLARVRYLNKIEDLKATITLLEEREVPKVEHFTIRPESGNTGMMTDTASAVHVNENVQDYLGSTQNVVDHSTPTVSDQGQREILGIDDFFRRPIKIADGNLTIGSHLTAEHPVWDLYTLNPAVRAKLRNYAYLRGELHLRISLTGTPFNYGKVLFSYQPQPLRNQTLQNIVAYPNTEILRNYLSQSPDAAVLDVCENAPVEMTCPFICHKEMGNLYNNSATVITDTTAFEDFEEFGSLFLATLNVPRSASDGDEPIRYYIYAWMENVELGTTTGTHLAIRTESSSEPPRDFRIRPESGADERDTGPVENFASGAEEISGALKDIPVIGTVAKASEIGFGALKKVASIFGWARPVLTHDATLVKNMPFQNSALTIGSETNYRLVLDPKQELTVAPRIFGEEQDVMSLEYIASTKSFLTTFTWAVTDNPNEYIWYSAVTPDLRSTESITGGIISQPTPMAFALRPFDSWRADIVFTFQIACSKFHRGKLMFVYEPNNSQGSLIAASEFGLNRQYVKIIDIQETQEISFCVKWAHYRAWCEHRAENSLTVPGMYGSSYNTAASYSNGMNGIIFVAPFNGLVSPDAADIDLEINVYVHAENFKVNRYTGRHMEYQTDVAEMLLMENTPIKPESRLGSSLSSQDVECVVMNDSTATTQEISQDHYGEQPVSFRSLLKRYDRYGVVRDSLNGTESLGYLTMRNQIMPYVDYSSTSERHNMFNYVRRAYVGMRGSIRHRYNFITNATQQSNYPVAISLSEDNSSTYTQSLVTEGSAYGNSYEDSMCRPDGTALFVLDTNAGVEVEYPFYSRNLFHYAFASDDVGSNPGGKQNMETSWCKTGDVTYIQISKTGSQSFQLMVDMAIGEDFSFYRFQGTQFEVLEDA